MATPPSPPSTPPRPPPLLPAGLSRRKLNIALKPLLDSPAQPQSPDTPRAERDNLDLSDAHSASAEKHLQQDMERSLPTPSSTPALPELLVVNTRGTESGRQDEPRLHNPYFPSSPHPLQPVPIAPRPMAHLAFHLQAVDSPSLLTPSPFSLYPPTPPGVRGPKSLPNAGFRWDPELAEDDVSPSGPLPTHARPPTTRVQHGGSANLRAACIGQSAI